MTPSDAAPPPEDRLPAVPVPRWREALRQRSVLLATAVALFMAACVAAGLVVARQQAIDGELRTLTTLSAALADQAEGTLAAAETALRATADELASGALQPEDDTAQITFRTLASALPRVSRLLILDAEGQEVASSDEAAGPVAGHAETPYFAAAREALGPSLRVGRPQAWPGLRGPVVPLSMPRYSTFGVFEGVVLLLVEPDFLQGGFARGALATDARLALLRPGGELFSRSAPDGWTPPGLAGADGRSLQLAADGRHWLVAYQPLRRSPLTVAVWRDRAAVLQDWREQAWLVGAFVVSALLVTLLLSLRNAREQLWRQASQGALARQHERSQHALQAAREGAWEWHPADRSHHLSPRMKELLGLPRDRPSPAGEPLQVAQGLHPDDAGRLRAAVQAHLQASPAGVTDSGAGFACTIRIDAGAGLGAQGWRHVRLRGRALRDARGAPRLFIGTADDVTDEVLADQQARRLDEQLQRARRLEAVGTLAGGVAHDFNNVLAAIIGFGERARSGAPDGSASARQLDQVLQAGRRGQALVARLLAVSRPGPRQHQRFEAQPVVEEVLALLGGSLAPDHHGVQLDTRLLAAGAQVQGDATAWFEAVMNLCTNALQAMPGGGRLGVALACETLDQERVLWQGRLALGAWLRLSVTDQGPGIDEAVLPHLLEPFFTTKAPGQGTGLGLTVVHSVAVDMGGGIDLATGVGQGTRFDLYLPLAPADDPAAGAGTTAPDGPADTADLPRGQGQVVMVVDDEPALVELAEDLLAELGYEPLGFTDAAQALARFEAEPERVDLLLTDEVMPGLTGTELARRLLLLRPGLPVLIASGYGGPDFQARAAQAGVLQVLGKPLARRELARALDRARLRGSAT